METTKEKTWLAAALLVTALLAPLARAEGGDPKRAPKYGAFPARWVELTENLYPIVSKPRAIQYQAWLAVQALSSVPEGEPFIVDAFSASHEAADRVVRYLVDHHYFPENRFVIRPHGTEESGSWKGWIVVRPQGIQVAANAPEWTVAEPDVIRTSLASPLTDDEVKSLTAYSEEPLAWAEASGPVVHPSIGLTWFNVSGDSRLSPKTRAGWLGLDLGADFALLNTPAHEAGPAASIYNSLTALTHDAMDGGAADLFVGGFYTFKAEPSDLGVIHVRASAGFHGNWRWAEGSSPYLPPIRGPRIGVTTSTGFDEALRIGVATSYTMAGDGIVDLGAFLSHRFLTTGKNAWEIRLGVNAALAQLETRSLLLEETWSSFKVGVTGTL